MPSFWTLIRRNFLVAAGYFITGILGLIFAIPPGHASAVWPPSGLALVAVMLWGPTVAPGLFLGSMAANLRATWNAFGDSHLELSLITAMGIACGTTLQALVIRQFLPSDDSWRTFLGSGRSALRFVLLAGPLGCLISATCGMAVLHAVDMPPSAGLGIGWLTWWLGDTVGVLLIVPLAFIHQYRRPAWTRRLRLEAAGTVLALVVVGGMVFHDLLRPKGIQLPVAEVILPALVWAVHRFGLQGAVWANLIATVIATWGTARGMGPFSPFGAETGLTLLDAYLLSYLAVSLVSAASADEARAAHVQLAVANVDLQDRVAQRTNDLRESQRKLGALLDNLPGMAYRCRNDDAWTMEFVSDGVKALTGYSAEALLGNQAKSFDDLIEPDDRDRIREAVQSSIAQRQPFEFVYRIHRADGDVRWVWEQGTGVFDEQGDLLALEGLITDITEQRRTEAERDVLVQDLQEALRVRQEFLSIASHELKTPITSLRLAVQRLLGLSTAGNLTPERLDRNLDTIERQSRRLGTLVESLLDVTRIQAGQLALAPEPCDLGGLIQDVVARLEPDASRSGTPIAIEAASPLQGHWDRHQLDQVLTNLLSNAIKYGQSRPITIVAQLAGQDCLVQVIDQGIGIPATDLRRIFAPFERAVSANHYGGLGLGLYIVQRIVGAHGGEIWADSNASGGTTMHLRLPLQATKEPAPADSQTS
jgi:PAS domain S-box-containing protein